MDGAGSLGLGLQLNSGILLQGVWENGAVAYVVLNDRDEDVDLTFSECREADDRDGCPFGRTVATWHLPPRSLRKVTGADALAVSSANESEMVGGSANGQMLGILLRDVAPFASERAVVSNADINSSSGARDNVGQVETEFLVAPAAAFALELSLPVTGILTLASSTDPLPGLPFLDVVGARSVDATVSTTESGFRVEVPETASVESPARVTVDVRYPSGFAGKLVGFDASFCMDQTRSSLCLEGERIQRAIPAESPLP
jgi:hypothetical protein